jgi:hypothetical protein
MSFFVHGRDATHQAENPWQIAKLKLGKQKVEINQSNTENLKH